MTLASGLNACLSLEKQLCTHYTSSRSS